jgi:hypothetical protein
MPLKKRAGREAVKLTDKRGSQLWLILLEDADKTEWPPTIEGQNWRVVLSSSDNLQGCNQGGLYRTSPVFPVTERFNPPDFQAGIYYLNFFCFDPAFPVLGRLLHSAPKELTDGLLYTTGLASILLLSKREALANDVERIARAAARSKETWKVDHGRIVSISCHCSSPRGEDSHFTLAKYDSLPLVPKTTVDEFVANMAVLMPKVRLHIPGEIDTFVRLIALANELVQEMVYVCNPIGSPPETLSEYTQQQFAKHPSLCTRILHQDTDRLVQINSALSYVSTQALSGAVPILDRRSLIRRYSLLGVGTATLALTRIAHSIERAFAKGALENILSERAGDAAALPGLDNLPEYDSRKWKEFSVDAWNGKVNARESYPKLPYFSGRLGFREAEYTVSAALQSLAAGAGAEWSLLTLTHEMLHGHVRNLLSMLFQGDPNRRPDEKWDDFYARFEARCNGQPPAKENLLDSLRAIILSYCCNAISHGSLTRDIVGAGQGYKEQEISLSFPLLARDSLWLAYEAEYRNISEIFVHILDLHYFYCSSLSHYVRLIWRSWSTVPQVWADLRQYILRSLLVVATKTEGTAYERFGSARLRLVEILEGLQSDSTLPAPVINEALKRLKREYAEKHLFYPFAASMILVDVVHQVLTSSAIRGSLNAGDPHFSLAPTTTFEEWLLYDMPDKFVDDVVISPTAYLADRLSREVQQPEGQALEAKTAAMFLACASHVVRGATNV